MAYGINPRFAEGVALDRITNGGRGIDEFDQRELVRRGMMPSRQAVINEQQNKQRMSQESLKQEKLRTKALQQATDQQEYNRWKQGWNDFAEVHGRGRPIQGSNGKTGYNPKGTTTPQPKYSYDIDYQAANDAGSFLRALEGGDVETAIGLLNQNQYSSINNAAGLDFSTDDKGNQALSVLGEDGQVLRTVGMDQLRKQLSNLNNYATRYQTAYTPGREALLGSKELAEGAAAAGQAAFDTATAGTTMKDGRYTRAGRNGGLETMDPDSARQKAYDTYMKKYGSREAGISRKRDDKYLESQTPVRYGDPRGNSQGSNAGLGFATSLRQKPGTANPSGNDARSLAALLAGGNKSKTGQTVELPEPDPTQTPIANNDPQENNWGYWGFNAGSLRGNR